MTGALLGDLRHSFRQLIRTPAFTLPAIAGLALAIGATTAVFSVVDTMLLRSMGLEATERLVTLWQTDPRRGQKHIEVSYSDLIAWRSLGDIFSDVALASSVNLDFPLLGDGEPQQVDGATALLVIAAAACLIPAWRAAKTDPLRSLQSE